MEKIILVKLMMKLILKIFPEETVKNFVNYFPHNNIEQICKELKKTQAKAFFLNIYYSKQDKRIKAYFRLKNFVFKILRSINQKKKRKNSFKF